MRKLFLMGCAVLLGACGGGNNNNNNGNNGTPGLKTFSYGAPQAPTAAQQSTANKAQTQLNSAVNASVKGQVAGAANLPSMTDSLAASLPALMAVPGDPELTISSSSPASFLARHSGALNQGCYTVSSSSITYSNCTISSTGLTETLNGNLSVSNSIATWNLTVTFDYSAGGITEHGTYNWTGQLTSGATTIIGQGRSSFTGHYTGSGYTVDYAYTAGFDSNLTYQTSPSFCLAGGTLEVRRTLNSTTNSQAAPVHDAAAKYTWSGCGSVAVANGTP
jgi:hypothetical protein